MRFRDKCIPFFFTRNFNPYIKHEHVSDSSENLRAVARAIRPVHRTCNRPKLGRRWYRGEGSLGTYPLVAHEFPRVHVRHIHKAVCRQDSG